MMTSQQWERRESNKAVMIGLVSLLSGVALMGYGGRTMRTNPDCQAYLAARNNVTMIRHLEKELSQAPGTRMSAAQEEHMQHVLGDYRRLQSELQEQRSTEAYARGKAKERQVGLVNMIPGSLLILYSCWNLMKGYFTRNG